VVYDPVADEAFYATSAGGAFLNGERLPIKTSAPALKNAMAGVDLKRLDRAFAFAARCHEGQKRESGDPYIVHPLSVAHVLADMQMSQEALHVVNSVQGVIKIVAAGKLPQPLRQDEVNRLLGIVEETAAESPKEEIPFLVGQVVEITEGPFSDFSGTVEEVLADKGKVKVSVSLFGRPTTVEMDYLQLRGH
jgi:transcription antitermination factor NusG